MTANTQNREDNILFSYVDDIKKISYELNDYLELKPNKGKVIVIVDEIDTPLSFLVVYTNIGLFRNNEKLKKHTYFRGLPIRSKIL